MASFFCNNCGDSFTGTWEEVKEHKRKHKVKPPPWVTLQTAYCRMYPTGRGTIARPSLIPFIEKEIKESEIETEE